MPALEKSVRAPAYGNSHPVLGALKSLILWLLWPIIGCRHDKPSMPFNGHQTCLECGATRTHFSSFDYSLADAGTQIGPWRKAVPPQVASRVIASKLITDAMRVSTPLPFYAPIPTHCTDCGEELDVFGICHRAATVDVKLSASPVFCGHRKHA